MVMKEAHWLIVLVLPALAVVAGAAEIPVSIGVISPTGGSRSIRAGQGHEASIRMGLEHAGRAIRAGNVTVKLRTTYKNDHGNPESSAQIARTLAEQQDVVVILGPVNSACTEAVLAAGLGVPIISSLSTSPLLTDPRNPWFFRITLQDRQRMQQLATHVRRDAGVRSALLLYENDSFGVGLEAALAEQPGLAVAAAKTWDAISETGQASAEVLQHMREGAGFAEDFRRARTRPRRRLRSGDRGGVSRDRARARDCLAAARLPAAGGGLSRRRQRAVFDEAQGRRRSATRCSTSATRPITQSSPACWTSSRSVTRACAGISTSQPTRQRASSSSMRSATLSSRKAPSPT
jgi:hypothetical protein